MLNNYNQPLAGGRHVTGYEHTAMGGFGDSSQENMAYDSMDSGEDVDGPAHREMAIDVPANFIGCCLCLYVFNPSSHRAGLMFHIQRSV